MTVMHANDKCPVSGESRAEEILNWLTHGLGCVGSVLGLILLLKLGWDGHSISYMVSCGIYGTTLVLLYGASTWYHACRCPRRKQVLKSVDHACIYLLIAGSYTPFTLGPLYGPWGIGLLVAVWSLAAIGVTLKALRIHLSPLMGSLFYLGMGWLAVVAIGPLLETLSFPALALIVAGGLSYSFGVIFYLWERLKYSHAIWHVFVLAGSAFHFSCVLLFLE